MTYVGVSIHVSEAAQHAGPDDSTCDVHRGSRRDMYYIQYAAHVRLTCEISPVL